LGKPRGDARQAERRTFLRGQKYRELGDPELVVLARRMRLFSRGYLFGMVIFAIGFALSIRRDWPLYFPK